MSALQNEAGFRTEPNRAGHDLSGQMSLLEGAHGALASARPEHALEMSRRYMRTYPTGLFHLEADAVCIHALVMLGRSAEASVLAERFMVVYGKSPLAKRLRRIAQ